MSDLVVALGGVVAGAAATGALQTVQAARARRVRVRVAARLLRVELGLADFRLMEIDHAQRWPNLPIDFSSLLATWEAQRVAFAEGASVAEWEAVAASCRLLADTKSVAHPGEPLDEHDLRSLGVQLRMMKTAVAATTWKSHTLRQRVGRRWSATWLAAIAARIEAAEASQDITYRLQPVTPREESTGGGERQPEPRGEESP